jgi:hypothetical protein
MNSSRSIALLASIWISRRFLAFVRVVYLVSGGIRHSEAVGMQVTLCLPCCLVSPEKEGTRLPYSTILPRTAFRIALSHTAWLGRLLFIGNDTIILVNTAHIHPSYNDLCWTCQCRGILLSTKALRKLVTETALRSLHTDRVEGANHINIRSRLRA